MKLQWLSSATTTNASYLLGIVSTLLLLDNNNNNNFINAQPLPEVERHVDRVIVKHAGSASLFDHGGITSRSFVSNRCAPQQGGYFGATYGDPTIVTYGFELETTTTSSTNAKTIADRIKGAVVNEVLTSTFPQVCDSSSSTTTNSQWNIGQIWGFQFQSEFLLSSDSCSPLHDVNNTCGSYESSLVIFGSGTEELRQKVLSIIQGVLSSNETKAMDPAIVSILPMTIQREKVSIQQQQPTNVAKTSNASNGGGGGSYKMAPVGIALTVMAVIFGVAALVAFQWRRMTYHHSKQQRNNGMADGSNTSICDDDSNMDYDYIPHFLRRVNTEISDDITTDADRSRGSSWGHETAEIDMDYDEDEDDHHHRVRPAFINKWKWVV